MQRVLAASKLSVRPSVCPSVKRVDRKEERSAEIFIKYEKYPSFIRRIVRVGNPIYVKFWVKLTLLERNRRFSVVIRF